jgi:hypothetical protein
MEKYFCCGKKNCHRKKYWFVINKLISIKMKMSIYFNNLFLLLFIVCVCIPRNVKAYSVLTHEAIVDASWEKSLKPLLLNKYPGINDSILNIAHAYAYGGAIAPDMGYFPFGSHLFTNLVHYVRSGDFVTALIDEANDVNEYAFALGYLSHYMADRYGHLMGTNICVPMVYPKIKEKFGDTVTYEDDKISHKRIEFAFDVLQTAKGNYASNAYRNFIGFNVSLPLLEKAFLKTYGLDINDVFRNISVSIETFRWSVKNLFPFITKLTWSIKKNEILKTQPTATSRSFKYKMNKANYKHEFGGNHNQPGFFTKSLSWLIFMLPKVGPLRPLKIKALDANAEKIFIKSFDSVMYHYTIAVKNLQQRKIKLDDIDFDTGEDTKPGEYQMADAAYNSLLLQLHKNKFKGVDNDAKMNIIDFYKNSKAPTTKKGKRKWIKVMKAIEELKVYAAI